MRGMQMNSMIAYRTYAVHRLRYRPGSRMDIASQADSHREKP